MVWLRMRVTSVQMVVVLPVPGIPTISVKSLDNKTFFMACFWGLLRPTQTETITDSKEIMITYDLKINPGRKKNYPDFAVNPLFIQSLRNTACTVFWTSWDFNDSLQKSNKR